MRATVIMAGEDNKKKEHDPIFMVCLVLFVIAAVAVLGVYAADHLVSSEDGTAAYGDSVTVDYTGTYYNYIGEDGAVVFDTSYKSVADDKDITKSSEFTPRSSYSPLSVTIGSGSALKMFEDSIVGHKVGDKFRVMIPAEDAYVGSEIRKTVPLAGFTVPETQEIPSGVFSSLYGKTLAAGETYYFKTVYGWNASATFVSDTNIVTIFNMPEVGKTYTYSPKGTAPAEGEEKVTFSVVSVDGNVIKSDLSFKNCKYVSGNTIQMIELDFGTEKWFVTEVSSSDFTYKVTDKGNVNEDLYFEIKLVSIG